MKKYLINLSLSFAVLSLFLLNAMTLNATNFNTETVDPLKENKVNNSTSNMINETTNKNETIKDVGKEVTESTVTVEGLFGKIQEKLNKLLQNGTVFALSLCVVTFIISALFLAFDALNQRGTIWRGTIGMICAAVAYTCIKYGPTIIEALSQWLIS